MGAAREPWVSVARRTLPAMRAWRTAFHQEPELSLHEERTREKIVAALKELGVPYRTYDDFYGVVGTIGADRSGPVVALRADMDALPVTERTGLAFQSRYPGKMHACGHDVHMSALLGAAAMLVRGGRSTGGPVKLLFQPAEEEGDRGGALPLMEHGCLEDPKVDYVVGQHVDPALPLGTVGWRIGPTMAAADYFRITVLGRGGHASTPQQGPDAIVIASEIVTGLQTLVSRVREPFDPVVVSVGSVHGGTRHNILPSEVVLEGTVRTLRASTRELMERALRRKVRAIAAGHGAKARVVYRQGYPPLLNPAGPTRWEWGKSQRKGRTGRCGAGDLRCGRISKNPFAASHGVWPYRREHQSEAGQTQCANHAFGDVPSAFVRHRSPPGSQLLLWHGEN